MILHFPIKLNLSFAGQSESESSYFIQGLSQVKSGLLLGMIAQLVKNLPAIQETPVWFLGREDPPEKGKATHSSILAWRIPWIG